MRLLSKQLVVCFFLLILAFTIRGHVLATSEIHASSSTALSNEPHKYEITTSSLEWAEMTLSQRLNACAVSAAEAKSMTTSALLETVLNYPFLVNIYAYDSLEDGIAIVCSYFPGLEELLAREDAIYVLNEYLKGNIATT